MLRNPRLLATLAVLWSLFAGPAAAGADSPEQPDALVTPVAEALATLAPDVDWPGAGEQPPPATPAPPASALRARVSERDEPVWVMTVLDVCASERGGITVVRLFSSRPAQIFVRVHDEDRTLARTRLPRVMGERTVTLVAAELRRGRTYWVEVFAQRPDEPTLKTRRRLVVPSACR